MQTYLGDDESLDEHYDAASNHGSKCNNVQASLYVKDDVAWAGQMIC